MDGGEEEGYEAGEGPTGTTTRHAPPAAPCCLPSLPHPPTTKQHTHRPACCASCSPAQRDGQPLECHGDALADRQAARAAKGPQTEQLKRSCRRGRRARMAVVSASFVVGRPAPVARGWQGCSAAARAGCRRGAQSPTYATQGHPEDCCCCRCHCRYELRVRSGPGPGLGSPPGMLGPSRDGAMLASMPRYLTPCSDSSSCPSAATGASASVVACARKARPSGNSSGRAALGRWGGATTLPNPSARASAPPWRVSGAPLEWRGPP
jgi:hypothetical protein